MSSIKEVHIVAPNLNHASIDSVRKPFQECTWSRVTKTKIMHTCNRKHFKALANNDFVGLELIYTMRTMYL